MTDVFILSGVRTAIGSFGGSLAGTPPTELAAKVVAEALRRADLAGDQIGHSVFGHVINTEPRDMYLARVAAIEAGIAKEAPALTLNRLCGSGLQAVITAAQGILLGDYDTAVAGGAESMSRAPHATNKIRMGLKMGDLALTDMMIGALTDPFETIHMGVTAENVAEAYGISRAAQDAFAVESQRRASEAQAAGRFDSQILPIEVKSGRGVTSFARDEHLKADTTLASLEKLRPAFRKDGSVTAGNASGLNDGAAALTLMSGDRVRAEGRKPMARIVGYALTGVAPNQMGIGPISAVQRLMAKTGLGVADFDVIESNEAFASQACAVSQTLGLPADKTNPNGGAIALGHPVGASGAIILVKTLYELDRIDGRFGLCTMCIGGGQGIALAVERMG